MNPFPTLLHREWMQHHRGWLVMMLAPLVIGLAVLIFGRVEFGSIEIDGVRVAHEGMPPAAAMAAIGMLISAAALLIIATLNAAFQASGLARRDQQDRSIEFWVSLPVGHSQSLGATLLMHFLLVPWLALLVGAIGGQVIALALVARTHGVAEWFALPWSTLLPLVLTMTLRLALGLALAMLWVSPLLMLTMVASAWLKRWGLPVVIIGFALLGVTLEKLYGITLVGDTLEAIARNAGLAFMAGSSKHGDFSIKPGDDIDAVLAGAPQWAWADAGAALQAAASPLFMGGLAVAAACFALLVFRRQRA